MAFRRPRGSTISEHSQSNTIDTNTAGPRRAPTVTTPDSVEPTSIAAASADVPLGYEAPAGNQRFPLIDSLRGLAAASVFLYHFSSAGSGVHGVLGDLFDHGDFGVVLFFLISGFLLYRPFIIAREHATPPVSVRRFYERRALRIIPAYWTALTLLSIYPGLPDFHNRWWQLYGFGQIYDPSTRFAGIAPAWSLCVEVSFYAVLPLYAYAIARTLGGKAGRARLWAELLLLATLALLSVAFHQVLHHSGSEANLEFTLPGTFYLFAIGMALAVASVRWQGTRIPDLISRWWTLLWLSALALYVVIAVTVNSQTLGSVNPVWAIVAVLILLPATVPSDRFGAKVLGSRAITWLGVISYAFYLWHQAVIGTLARHIHSMPALFAAALALTVGIAALSYYVVEAPFLRIKARLAGRTRYGWTRSAASGASAPRSPAE